MNRTVPNRSEMDLLGRDMGLVRSSSFYSPSINSFEPAVWFSSNEQNQDTENYCYIGTCSGEMKQQEVIWVAILKEIVKNNN